MIMKRKSILNLINSLKYTFKIREQILSIRVRKCQHLLKQKIKNFKYIYNK